MSETKDNQIVESKPSFMRSLVSGTMGGVSLT